MKRLNRSTIKINRSRKDRKAKRSKTKMDKGNTKNRKVKKGRRKMSIKTRRNGKAKATKERGER